MCEIIMVCEIADVGPCQAVTHMFLEWVKKKGANTGFVHSALVTTTIVVLWSSHHELCFVTIQKL